MLTSILGTKIGMTQIFDKTGNVIPVTVISAGPCTITGLRTKEKDGYVAIQLGYGEIKEKSLNKPYAGIFKKLSITPKKYLQEFRVSDVSGFQIGQEVKVDIFKEGEYVDVSGISKGKGFAGTVKRHNFGGGPKTHGQSDRQRAPGNVGSQRPQRVLKGQKMAGHLGDEKVTIIKMKVVGVDNEKNFILIEGAVPGVNKGLIVIKKTVKTIKVHHADASASKKKAAKPAGKK
ncbi:MAG: 50S ribosomal protein L3 [Elusimicrobiota bacterium]